MSNEKLFKIGEAAKQVGRSNQTILLWYTAVENGINIDAELPEAKIVNGIRYYTQEDIDKLIVFRDKVKRGSMAEYNRLHKWGARGKNISEKIEAGEATPKKDKN